jgi:hypothetical protein
MRQVSQLRGTLEKSAVSSSSQTTAATTTPTTQTLKTVGILNGRRRLGGLHRGVISPPSLSCSPPAVRGNRVA